MKIEIVRQMLVTLEMDELDVVIHSLQSHEENGDNHNWPGEGTKAGRMRDDLINACDTFDLRR